MIFSFTFDISNQIGRFRNVVKIADMICCIKILSCTHLVVNMPRGRVIKVRLMRGFPTRSTSDENFQRVTAGCLGIISSSGKSCFLSKRLVLL